MHNVFYMVLLNRRKKGVIRLSKIVTNQTCLVLNHMQLYALKVSAVKTEVSSSIPKQATKIKVLLGLGHTVLFLYDQSCLIIAKTLITIILVNIDRPFFVCVVVFLKI